jgi:hypothetical protein
MASEGCRRRSSEVPMQTYDVFDIDHVLSFHAVPLEEALLALYAVSTAQACPAAVRTRHGLLSSKPAGAIGLSVWPRAKPVSRRSRSITASW